VLKCNDDEIGTLAPFFECPMPSLARFCEHAVTRWNIEYCVVTAGQRGAYAAGRDGQRVYDPGYRVAVVDTVGSGDAFTAGFISCLLENRSLEDACRRGNVLGAMVAGSAGATHPFTKEDIESFRSDEVERIVDYPEERKSGGVE
jgi:fructokinase